MSDISKLQLLGIGMENGDPFPKNLPNLGTMHHAHVSIGISYNQNFCPKIQENFKNVNGQISQQFHGK